MLVSNPLLVTGTEYEAAMMQNCNAYHLQPDILPCGCILACNRKSTKHASFPQLFLLAHRSTPKKEVTGRSFFWVVRH
uniref:Uncharacterized protein n=1 Tax=Arundo donax TaxID=35708 RepID=A0A0A9QUL0_ARUDO